MCSSLEQCKIGTSNGERTSRECALAVTPSDPHSNPLMVKQACSSLSKQKLLSFLSASYIRLTSVSHQPKWPPTSLREEAMAPAWTENTSCGCDKRTRVQSLRKPRENRAHAMRSRTRSRAASLSGAVEPGPPVRTPGAAALGAAPQRAAVDVLGDSRETVVAGLT